MRRLKEGGEEVIALSSDQNTSPSPPPLSSQTSQYVYSHRSWGVFLPANQRSTCLPYSSPLYIDPALLYKSTFLTWSPSCFSFYLLPPMGSWWGRGIEERETEIQEFRLEQMWKLAIWKEQNAAKVNQRKCVWFTGNRPSKHQSSQTVLSEMCSTKTDSTETNKPCPKKYRRGKAGRHWVSHYNVNKMNRKIISSAAHPNGNL